MLSDSLISILFSSGDGGCSKKTKILVSDTTTLRQHMQSAHASLYRRWCKKTGFKSMLPEDTKARRAALLEETLRQTEVDEHFTKQKPEDRPQPYSDKLFEEVAIQWLIETDQPIQAFQHRTFKKMIDVAARATRGVNIPGGKRTREVIVKTFKEQMQALGERLNDVCIVTSTTRSLTYQPQS
ncbi:hypothetical protein F5887DRAFT_889826 [Amanita rubescens]|nr:hypothetical protein F5887DRAFT_889826 [Amanita rubescens]